jgi:hypothetical protein
MSNNSAVCIKAWECTTLGGLWLGIWREECAGHVPVSLVCCTLGGGQQTLWETGFPGSFPTLPTGKVRKENLGKTCFSQSEGFMVNAV